MLQRLEDSVGDTKEEDMTDFEKLTTEMVSFLRGKYRLDEVAGMYYDVPCIRFRQGKKTIVSINLYENYYEVQLVL